MPYQYPAGIYLFKVKNRNTRTMCEICSKLTIKTPEQCHWRRSGVFIVNFEHVFARWVVPYNNHTIPSSMKSPRLEIWI